MLGYKKKKEYIGHDSDVGSIYSLSYISISPKNRILVGLQKFYDYKKEIGF